MRAVQIAEFGGPEVLQVVDLPDPEPSDGMQVLSVDTAGVNYADTHQVEDSYLSKTTLPLIPGSEVVGRLPDGSRVAAFAMAGGYAEKALVHPAMSFPVPDGVTDGLRRASTGEAVTGLWKTGARSAASSEGPRRRSRCFGARVHEAQVVPDASVSPLARRAVWATVRLRAPVGVGEDREGRRTTYRARRESAAGACERPWQRCHRNVSPLLCAHPQ